MPKRIDDGINKRCACGRRRWAKCGHAWHFNWLHDGRRHRQSLKFIARARGEEPPASHAEAAAWRALIVAVSSRFASASAPMLF